MGGRDGTGRDLCLCRERVPFSDPGCNEDGDAVARGRISVLTPDECTFLLGQARVGRVGVTVASLPEIFPVNFCVIDGDIVFRTSEGTKLHGATREAIVAFEVDEFDEENESGWSVLVVGPSSEERDPNLILDARRQLPDHWVPGERDHVIRIAPQKVSGRRIESR